jgi:hypothetical protein
MPRLNGIELAKILAKERPTIKIMLVSGSSNDGIPLHCRLLQKPFTTGALRQAVVSLLASVQ